MEQSSELSLLEQRKSWNCLSFRQVMDDGNDMPCTRQRNVELGTRFSFQLAPWVFQPRHHLFRGIDNDPVETEAFRTAERERG